MKLPDIKWPIALIAFVIASAMLFAGYWLWQRSAVQGPLQEQLAAVNGVESVEIKSEKNLLSVNLGIRPDAELLVVGEEVSSILGKVVPGQPIEVNWTDSPNEQLTAARDQIDLALKEAQRRHEFVVMADRIAQMTKTVGVSYRVGVGEQAIYLELRAGDNVLYDVLPIIQAGGEDR